ncbi:MAG: cell division protein ZapA [Candidatus Latescibacteria bacterium]|nr:cell division protein ZapA [Candidatus Latescibacterota bacterium]
METIPETGTLMRICGDEYRMTSELDTADLRRVAAYVDLKMRETASRSGNSNKTQLAVLAAMDIATELLKSQQEKGLMLQKACESIDLLRHLVEERSSLLSLTSDWSQNQPELTPKKRLPLLQQIKRF